VDLAHTRRELYKNQGGVCVLMYEGTITADGDTKTSKPIYVMPFKEGTFFINVSEHSGTTPTLDMLVVTKHPQQDQWETLVTFTQIGDTNGHEMKPVAANLGETIALSWTKGGTSPSYTVKIYAVLKVY
jgi:hypothetical protein